MRSASVPAAFADRRIRADGDAGRAWIAALPALVDRRVRQWGLEVDERLDHTRTLAGLPLTEAAAIARPLRAHPHRAGRQLSHALVLGRPQSLR
jgi:streptomycin 6-kinase